MTTKAEFLSRIRARQSPGDVNAMSRGASLADAVTERPARPADAVEFVRRQISERWRETLDRFRTEFERAGGVFHRVARSDEVPGVIGRLARERKARRLISWHPDALDADWGEALAALALIVDPMPRGEIHDEGSRPALRRLIADADLGLTGADLAVAETGSLVLIAGRGRPRSTSLLPSCHIAVFGRSALVESLAHVGVYLEAWHDSGAPVWKGGVINVITGPSRTADIELTLTRGVHGPKELHAIFVDAAASTGAGSHG